MAMEVPAFTHCTSSVCTHSNNGMKMVGKGRIIQWVGIETRSVWINKRFSFLLKLVQPAQDNQITSVM